jgi:hypothetical protein
MSVDTYITSMQNIFSCGDTWIILVCAAIRCRVDTGPINDMTFTALTKSLSPGDLPEAGATLTLGICGTESGFAEHSSSAK